jgi:hypothetical protein
MPAGDEAFKSAESSRDHFSLLYRTVAVRRMKLMRRHRRAPRIQCVSVNNQFLLIFTVDSVTLFLWWMNENCLGLLG